MRLAQYRAHLRRVFYYRCLCRLAIVLIAVHLCRHAIEMDRDNCFCAWRDCGFKLRRAHCATRRIDIYKNWYGTDINVKIDSKAKETL
jgi:hypothetical protein